ncbi:sugar phosphate isomerase/epimerase [Lutibacter oceani]|uniref:Sugar phosphate isomerase/epimerase n=1 Tax=Lutibacter oceani TaxID=1853311 RepID=A0A3D9S3F7_9FLAO|nr:sugar phosphate isomerase/epimerase family protein [Lutibacter oceani]REE83385.1 sugar phosphate isomerase/epimerase [Lutibacter oceani]
MKLKQITLKTTILVVAFSILGFYSCKDTKKDQPKEEITVVKEENPVFFKLSLAQWSLNQQIRNGEMNPIDFAQKASELGFEGIEYVSQLYTPELQKTEDQKLAMETLLNTLKEKSDTYKVQSLLIMVDNEGDLAATEEALRDEAVENHKKWVDAAQFLGCHSIRVNLFGTNDPEVWKQTAADGLTKLANYAADKNINIIVENHGYLSSNAALLVEVIHKVNLPNCGVLPDFGNFCLNRENGERWQAKCIEEYDRYQGVKEMMPVAKAVSAKSYDFDENGDETTIDYTKMLQIVKDAGYNGFIGVEYEGSRLGEVDGIIATKNLLLNAAKKLN